VADDIIAAVMCAIILAAAFWAVCPRKPRPMPAAEMDALANATREPRPHPELAGPPPRELCQADRYYAANLRTWLAAQPEPDTITMNGRNLADYLRHALPDATDLDLGRAVRAMLRATPAYRAVDDPWVVYCDALAAAFLDLTSLERSTTP
jgi:hypothetical protein